MKTIQIFVLMMATILSVIPARADSSQQTVFATSDIFTIDTRDSNFRIENVSSAYCDGEYGVNGRHAVFLNGVSVEVEFIVTVSGVPLGESIAYYELSTSELVDQVFEINVGCLEVGSELTVTAVSDVGTRTKPFRLNFDIARCPDADVIWRVKEVGNGRIQYIAFDFSLLRFSDDLDGDFAVLGKFGKFKLRGGLDMSMIVESDTGMSSLELSAGGNGSGRLGRKKRNQDIGKFGNLSLSAGLKGDFSSAWEPAKLDWVQDSCSVFVFVDGEWELINFRPPPFPWAYFRLGLSSDCDFSVKQTDGYGFVGTVECDPLIKLKGTVGLGGRFACAIEGYVLGGIILNAHIPGTPNRTQDFGIEVAIGVTTHVFGFETMLQRELNHTWWFIGGPQAKVRALGVPCSIQSLKKDDFTLLTRDYLMPGQFGRMKTVSLPANLEEDSSPRSFMEVYPFPEPSIASGGGKDGFVYVTDDISRLAVNRTKLVFCEGVSNRWQVASAVWDDGTADFMPSLGVVSNGISIVSWVNGNTMLTSESTLESALQNMEIAVGVRNAETGTWVCQNLTNNSVLDHSPVVSVATNGEAMVTWIQNASNDYIGSADTPSSIYFSRYREGNWSAPAPIAESLGLVSGLELAFNGEGASIVYMFDGDGDMNTIEDQEIYGATYDGSSWGSVVPLTNNTISDGAPFVCYRETTHPWVLWNQDGTLMVSTNGFDVATAYSVTNGLENTLAMDCMFATGEDGKLAVVWNGVKGVGELAPDLGAIVYDNKSDSWSAPVALTHSANYERGVTAAFDATGALLAGYSSVVVSTNELGVIEYGAADLQCVRYPFGCDLAVEEESFCFATNTVQVGERVDFCFAVRNLGMESVTNVEIRVVKGDPDVNGVDLTDVFVVDFAGGERKEFSAPWMVNDMETNLVFTIDVDADCLTADMNRLNNRAVWEPMIPELVIQSVKSIHEGVTKRILTVTIENIGFKPAESGALVTFRRGSFDGELLGTDTLGCVLPGENGRCQASLTWDITESAFTEVYETVYVQIDSQNLVDEIDEDNNIKQIRVMTALDADGDGLLDGEEMNLGTNISLADSDGDGFNDYDEVHVHKTNPSSAMSKPSEKTESGIPHEWLDKFTELLSVNGGDYEKVATMQAANNENTVGECYIAGLNPTNETNKLFAKIEMVEGNPIITWTPDLNMGGSRVLRDYQIVRMKIENGRLIEDDVQIGNSGDSVAPLDENDKGPWLYRVKVKLP